MSLLGASKIELNGKKVLYVDDEVYRAETDRQFFTLKARLHPEDLLFADAFESALETLERYPEISTILVDLRIPKKSEDSYDYNPENPDEEWGEKLIKTIIEKYSGQRKIYIIVVSAYTIYTYNSEDSSSPILAFYSKPIDFDALLKNLEFIIKNNLEQTQLEKLLKDKRKSVPLPVKSFDYASLDEETSLFVQEKTVIIKRLAKRVAEDTIEIGQYLIEIKEKLGYGNFYAWIDAEFSWSYASAARFMQVASKFRSISLRGLDILPSALYQLAAPSAPEEATIEAFERAKQGEQITEKIAKELKLKYKQQKQGKAQPTNIEQLVSGQAETKVQEAQNRERLLPSPQINEPKPKQSIVAVIPSSNAVPKSWWQLGEHHRLFCGEPKDQEFLKRLPENIALTIDFLPKKEPSLISPIESDSALTFYSKYKDLDLDWVAGLIEDYIDTSTQAKEIVVFNYIYDVQLLELTENLRCYCYVAEPDLEKCEQILTIWREKGTVMRITN